MAKAKGRPRKHPVPVIPKTLTCKYCNKEKLIELMFTKRRCIECENKKKRETLDRLKEMNKLKQAALSKKVVKPEDNVDAHKMKRILLLIHFLSEKRTVKECQDFMGTSFKTVYNYLRLLSDTGFNIHKSTNENNIVYYQLVNFTKRQEDVNRLSEKVAETGVLSEKGFDNLHKILTSPFLLKKPFVLALFGEYNQYTYGKFYRLVNNETAYRKLDKNKIIAMLRVLQTHIEMILS